MLSCTGPGTEVGRTAAELFFRRLDGDRSAPEQSIVVTQMIIRGSGEIAP
jgi:LacI family transcriptional regulator